MKIYPSQTGIWIDDKMYPDTDIAYVEITNAKEGALRLFAVNILDIFGEKHEIYCALDKSKAIEIFNSIKDKLIAKEDYIDLNKIVLNMSTLTDMHESVINLNKACICIIFGEHKRFVNISNRKKLKLAMNQYKSYKKKIQEIDKSI